MSGLMFIFKDKSISVCVYFKRFNDFALFPTFKILQVYCVTYKKNVIEHYEWGGLKVF